MKENKNNEVFSSIRSENTNNIPTPATVINNAFHEEQLRQTGKIPINEIKEAIKVDNSNITRLTLDEEIDEPKKDVVVQKTVQQPQTVETQQPKQVQAEQPKQVEEKVVPKQEVKKEKVKVIRQMKKGAKRALVAIILITAFIITILEMYHYFNNPKVIARKALLQLGTEVENIIDLNDELTIIGDNFNINTEITTKLESQKVQNDYNKDKELLEYYYLLNNLNNSKTTLDIEQDLENKKLFANSKTIKNDKVISEDKYLIENSTEYYYVKDFFENYINEGNNNYFETLTEDRNSIANMNYLYKAFFRTMPFCIEDSEYSVSNTTTYINGKTQNVKKVTLKLDNIKIRKLLNKTLKELKKDKVAFNILNGMIDDFSDYKITANTKFIDDNETITINYYTQGFFNDTKKYDVSLTGPKTQKGITFETENKEIVLLENNQVKNYIDYEKKNNLIVNIKDKNDKTIGKIELEKTQVRTHLTVDYNDGVKDIDIDLNYKVSDKKQTSYNSTTTISINMKEDNISTLSGIIEATSKVNNKPHIEEDIDEVVFSSEISNEKKDSLKDLLKTRLKKKID